MEIIFGAAVAGIVQFLKQYSPNPYATLGILLGVSIVAAIIYTQLVAMGYWQSVVGILTIAAAIYTLFIQRFESK